MATQWVVAIIALDGSISVVGPFRDEYAATIWGNEHETEESGWTCHVLLLEPPKELS